MAIKIKSTREDNDNKYDYPNAYLRIYDVEIKASYDKVRIGILLYGDAEARNMPDSMSISKYVEIVPLNKFTKYMIESKMNIMAAAYLYLKKELPGKYLGIDC